MPDDPPRIRDERRDPDLTRLKERVAVLEHDSTKMQQLVQGMHYALFGLPDDRNNNGIVGDMHEIRTSMESANTKLLGLLIAVAGGLGAVILDIATRHL